MNLFQSICCFFLADVPAELSRRRRIGTAPLKPLMWVPLHHLLVPQRPKPKILVALGLELASSGHCGKPATTGDAF